MDDQYTIYQTCTDSPLLRFMIHSDSRPQLSIQLNSILYSTMGQIITILNSLHFVSEDQNPILHSFIASINKCRFNSWIHCMMNISAGVVLCCSLYPLIYIRKAQKTPKGYTNTSQSRMIPVYSIKTLLKNPKVNQRIKTCRFSNDFLDSQLAHSMIQFRFNSCSCGPIQNSIHLISLELDSILFGLKRIESNPMNPTQ